MLVPRAFYRENTSVSLLLYENRQLQDGTIVCVTLPMENVAADQTSALCSELSCGRHEGVVIYQARQGHVCEVCTAGAAAVLAEGVMGFFVVISDVDTSSSEGDACLVLVRILLDGTDLQASVWARLRLSKKATPVTSVLLLEGPSVVWQANNAVHTVGLFDDSPSLVTTSLAGVIRWMGSTRGECSVNGKVLAQAELNGILEWRALNRNGEILGRQCLPDMGRCITAMCTSPELEGGLLLALDNGKIAMCAGTSVVNERDAGMAVSQVDILNLPGELGVLLFSMAERKAAVHTLNTWECVWSDSNVSSAAVELGWGMDGTSFVLIERDTENISTKCLASRVGAIATWRTKSGRKRNLTEAEVSATAAVAASLKGRVDMQLKELSAMQERRRTMTKMTRSGMSLVRALVNGESYSSPCASYNQCCHKLRPLQATSASTDEEPSTTKGVSSQLFHVDRLEASRRLHDWVVDATIRLVGRESVSRHVSLSVTSFGSTQIMTKPTLARVIPGDGRPITVRTVLARTAGILNAHPMISVFASHSTVRNDDAANESVLTMEFLGNVVLQRFPASSLSSSQAEAAASEFVFYQDIFITSKVSDLSQLPRVLCDQFPLGMVKAGSTNTLSTMEFVQSMGGDEGVASQSQHERAFENHVRFIYEYSPPVFSFRVEACSQADLVTMVQALASHIPDDASMRLGWSPGDMADYLSETIDSLRQLAQASLSEPPSKRFRVQRTSFQHMGHMTRSPPS